MITDWGTLGLGVWVDDLKLTDGATVLESNDFETDLGGWTVGPPPAGTDVPTNGWERRTEEFKEGGVVATDDTVYTGFGFEGINESARNEFMKRTLTHLGVLPTTSVSVPVDVGGTVEPTPTPTAAARARGRGSGAHHVRGRGARREQGQDAAREREAEVRQDAARESLSARSASG